MCSIKGASDDRWFFPMICHGRLLFGLGTVNTVDLRPQALQLHGRLMQCGVMMWGKPSFIRKWSRWFLTGDQTVAIVDESGEI